MSFRFDDLDKDIGLGADPLRKYIEAKTREIYSKREEIMEAFVAKYGFEPDRLTWVHQHTLEGTKEYVYRASDEEMELRKRKGIENQEQYRDAFNELLVALRTLVTPCPAHPYVQQAKAILEKYDYQNPTQEIHHVITEAEMPKSIHEI